MSTCPLAFLIEKLVCSLTFMTQRQGALYRSLIALHNDRQAQHHKRRARPTRKRRDFNADILDLEILMDHGWIALCVDCADEDPGCFEPQRWFRWLQVTTPTISASVGNRPSVCLEQAIRLSMRISKTPPPRAPQCHLRIWSDLADEVRRLTGARFIVSLTAVLDFDMHRLSSFVGEAVVVAQGATSVFSWRAPCRWGAASRRGPLGTSR